jgi:LysM repeat protein
MARISRYKISMTSVSMAGISITTFVIAAGAAFLVWLAVASFSLFAPAAAAVQDPRAAQLLPAKADATKKPALPAPTPAIAPPGSDLYQAQRGDSIPSVARKYLRRTKYLTSSELAEAIREANQRPPEGLTETR